MAKLPIVLFDLETTGLGVKGERVVPIQIAALFLHPDSLETLGVFETFVKIPAGAHLEEYAMEKMHAPRGWTVEFIQEAGVKPHLAYLKLREWITQFGYPKVRLGAHNAAFDAPILQREANLHDVKLPCDHHPLCTAVMAADRYVYVDQPVIETVSLKPLCDFLGVDLPAEAHHNAMNDVRATAQLLRIMKGKVS